MRWYRRRPLTRLLRALARLDSNGRWPIGLAGMLALLVGAEQAVCRLAPENLVAAAWRQTNDDAVTIAPACSLIAVGDSQTKHGLLVRLLEKRLGGRAYNLALQGATAPAIDHVLRRAIDAGARPRAILLNSALLSDDLFSSTRVYAELFGLRQAVALSWHARDGRLAGSIALAKALPSYREREGLREAVRNLLADRRFDPSWHLLAHRRNWRQNAGALVLAPPEEPPVLDHGGYLASIRWSLQPVNGIYLESILRLADDLGIPVYWLLYPIHPDVRDARDVPGWNADERAFLRSLLARHPGLTVLDGLHNADCPPEHLSDLTHLNSRGAVAFSRAVAEVLATSLAASDDPAAQRARNASERWIVLPAPRAGAGMAVELAVEDEKQSLEALAQIVRAERLRRKGLTTASGPPDEAARLR